MLLPLSIYPWEHRKGYWQCFGLAGKIISLGVSNYFQQIIVL